MKEYIRASGSQTNVCAQVEYPVFEMPETRSGSDFRFWNICIACTGWAPQIQKCRELQNLKLRTNMTCTMNDWDCSDFPLRSSLIIKTRLNWELSPKKSRMSFSRQRVCYLGRMPKRQQFVKTRQNLEPIFLGLNESHRLHLLSTLFDHLPCSGPY